MGGTSIWHWLVVGIIVLLLFGRGKISEMMGDVAKGIKAFKKGMSEEDAAAAPGQPGTTSEPVKTIEHQPAAAKPQEPAVSTGAPGAGPFGERKVG
jgi:sec-independent protein translocase protein TatA